MGKRGPKPTPTNILDRRNSWRGKARGAEPEPGLDDGDMPYGLGSYGAVAWQVLIPELVELKLLATIDRAVAIMACKAWHEYAITSNTIAKMFEDGIPLWIELKGGALQKHPILAMRDKAFDQYCKASKMLGLSPADRVGLPANAGKGPSAPAKGKMTNLEKHREANRKAREGK